MRAPRKCLIVSALAMAVLPTIASAAVVYSDGFESPTDTAGSAPVGGCTKGGGTSSFTMTVVSDATAGNGSQQALDLTSTTSSTRYGTTPFTATTLSPGDSIQLGFDLWFVGTLPTADRLFRFGLYNTALTNSPGITGRIGTGADTGTTYLDVYDSPKVFDVTSADGAVQVGNDKKDAGAVIDDDDFRYITLTVTLAADSSSLALTNAIYDANGNLLGSASGTDTTLEDTTFSFNDLAIGLNSGASGEYRLDNVTVTYTPAPEPARFQGPIH